MFEEKTWEEKKLARRAVQSPMAYRRMVWKATGQTSFSMAYGTKAVIPFQVTTIPNLHIKERTALENARILKSDLNFAKEY